VLDHLLKCIVFVIHLYRKLQSGGQHSSIAGNGGQSSNNQWASHTNTGQPFDPNGQPRQLPMAMQPTHAMQTSPNLPHTNPQLNSGLLPPRNIPTPQQAPQNPPHASTLNGMGSVSFAKPNTLLPKGPTSLQSSVGSVQGGNSNFISPLSMLGMDKSQFDSNFKTFLTRKGGNIDPHRFLEGRPLDLHGLYLHVMQEGGLSKASRYLLPLPLY
jgi:hypothetical protein